MTPIPFRWRAASLSLTLAAVLSACGGDDPQKMLASAKAFLDKNDTAAAIIQLKNALQEQPGLAEARFLLGKALLQSGDAAGAQTELQKAKDGGHPADEVIPMLMRSRLAQGKAREVTETYSGVQLTSPVARAELLTLLAIAAWQQQQLQVAELRLQEAVLAKPDHAPTLIELARFKAYKRDTDGAIQSLDKAISLTKDNAEAYKLKGDILLFANKGPELAVAAYRSAIDARPKYIDAHVSLVRALVAQNQVNEANTAMKSLVGFAGGHPNTLYLQTLMAFQQKDLATARSHSQQLLKKAPDSPLALEIAGIIELELGSLGQAEVHLSKALQSGAELKVARRALILTYLRSGQSDRAIAALPSDLEAVTDPAMLTVAGRAYMVKGDFERAAALMARAAKLDPSDPAKRTSVAVNQLLSGKSEQALSALSDIALSDSGVVADLALINAHLRRKDVDKALVAIDALQKKQPNDPVPSHLRGRALLLKNDRVGARKAFEQSLQANPNYMAALAALATLDLQEGKEPAARQRFEAFLKQNPGNVPAMLGLAEIRANAGAGQDEVLGLIRKAVEASPNDKTPRLLLVEQLLRVKDTKGALTAAQAAVAALPEDSDVIDALGRSQAANGDFNQALTSFNKVVALLPKSPMPLVRIASVHVANKNYAAAVQQLNKALELQPNLLLAQQALIELALTNRQTAEALKIAKSVQQQRPQDPVGHVLEAEVHVAAKNWDAAGQAYRAGFKLVPSPELVIRQHGVALAAGKAGDAERVLSEWFKLRPKDITVLMYLGDRALTLDKLADAQGFYERVIAIQPQNALALNNLAWVAGRQGRADAVALAQRSNEAAPNQPAFMDTLAALLSDKGEHAKALELQKKVLALQPEVPLYKLNLAKIQIKAGDKVAARKLLNEVAGLGDKFAGQEEVKKLTQALN